MAFDLAFAVQGATVALNLALAVAIGAILSALSLARCDSAWALERGRRLRLAGLGALAGAALAHGALLWFASAAMAEVPLGAAGAAVWSMLDATHFGRAWLFGMLALIVSAGALAPRGQGRPRRRALAVSLLALACLLYSRGMVSHAGASGEPGAPLLADWFHLMFACVWVGEVVVAGCVTLATPAPAGAAARGDAARHIESLSTSATVALAAIAASGLFSAAHNLGQPAALSNTPYGHTLLWKLALVALAATLGALNRFVYMPPLLDELRSGQIDAAAPMRRFTAILRLEAGVLLAVLVLAAQLSASSPPTAG
jgi:putative copper resistance protein D